jgi:hypothetical protein
MLLGGPYNPACHECERRRVEGLQAEAQRITDERMTEIARRVFAEEFSKRGLDPWNSLK